MKLKTGWGDDGMKGEMIMKMNDTRTDRERTMTKVECPDIYKFNFI